MYQITMIIIVCLALSNSWNEEREKNPHQLGFKPGPSDY